MLDFIIVGQGISGSMLSWFFLKEKQKVLVIDNFNPSSASNIASGVIKPITGKRFVKTWMADDIIPFAEKTYTELSELFRQEFFHPASFFKIFESAKAQNDWSARCASPDYFPYLKNGSVVYLDKEKVKNDLGGFEISGGSRLETEVFLASYRKYLSEQNSLLEEKFSFSDFREEGELVFYKNYQSRKIIFCEGASAMENPYFKFFPFQLAKGECLTLNIENFYADRIINGEVLVMPLAQKDLYYVGATHEWHFDDDQSTEKGKNELVGNVNTILNSPFEVVEQRAAIRPTVKDRRPFIGFHPEFINVGIFNGMGTKGISLAPYFAHHFAEHIFRQKPLLSEIDIKRFL